MSRPERGFTLIEVLMALTVFALIAAIAYGAMASAGQGFVMLQEARDARENQGWIGHQLRVDTANLATSAWQGHGEPLQPLMIGNDNRGADEFDDLLLFVNEPGRPGVYQVHYFIDEDAGHLVRESLLLWADDQAEPVRWDMGEASSWSVEAMNGDGRWQQEWKPSLAPGAKGFIWPRALRVRMKSADKSEREWMLPIEIGSEL